MRIVNPIAIKGEQIAVEYLKKKGYVIIERNFRGRNTEIDIIAIDPSTGSGQVDTLVFIEVKTRTSNQFGSPFEAIAFWKLRSLKKAALYYKLLHQKLPELLRIDAVGIILKSNNQIVSIELMKNITGF